MNLKDRILAAGRGRKYHAGQFLAKQTKHGCTKKLFATSLPVMLLLPGLVSLCSRQLRSDKTSEVNFESTDFPD